MEITNAKYFQDNNGNNVVVNCQIGGSYVSIPMDENNSDYKEILRQVNEGTLTIADAD
jgi:hypothetical protein